MVRKAIGLEHQRRVSKQTSKHLAKARGQGLNYFLVRDRQLNVLSQDTLFGVSNASPLDAKGCPLTTPTVGIVGLGIPIIVIYSILPNTPCVPYANQLGWFGGSM